MIGVSVSSSILCICIIIFNIVCLIGVSVSSSSSSILCRCIVMLKMIGKLYLKPPERAGKIGSMLY